MPLAVEVQSKLAVSGRFIIGESCSTTPASCYGGGVSVGGIVAACDRGNVAMAMATAEAGVEGVAYIMLWSISTNGEHRSLLPV